MKLTIPVSTSDVAKLPIFTDVLMHHGNLTRHSITLYPTRSVVAEAEEAASRLRQLCQCDVHPLKDFDGGWPKAPNAHWASVASLQQQPWLWLEVDTVPMRADWADALQREYNSCGTSFLGKVQQTQFKDGPKPNDQMLLGVAVYPPGLKMIRGAEPLMNDLLKLPLYSADLPFDLYLRWVFKRAGWTHTDSIQHCWKSTNFERSNGMLSYTDTNGNRATCEEGLLVHGCKDDSLYLIALSGKATLPPPPVEIIVESQPVKAIEALEPEPEQQSDLMASLKQVKPLAPFEPAAKVAELAPEAKPHIGSRFVLGPVTEQEEAGWPCSKEQFLAFMQEQEKTPRLRLFSEKFGFKSLDIARRAVGHWGYTAPSPHTFIRKASKK